MLLGGTARGEERPAVRSFSIAAKPSAQALIDLALQAGVSIDVSRARDCGASPAVKGRYTVQEALTLLLAGGRCTFTMVDARTVRIEPRPAPHPLPATTAPPASPQAAPVDELVVTATRREVLLDRAPAAISSTGRDALLAQRMDDLSSVAAQATGVTVTNLGPGRDKILIRGLSDGAFTGRTQSTVGLYLDDVPITYDAPDPDLRLLDVDRVEVLRGPQGTLYGAGSIGGIVHIVTRKPDLEHFTGSFDLSGAATDGGDGSHVVEGVLNIPLLHDRLALRAAGYRELDGGYIDDVALGLRNVNKTTRSGGRVSLRLAITPDWSLTGGLTHQSINSDDTQYAQEGLPTYQRANRLQEPHDNDFDQIYLTLEGDLALGRLKISAAQVRHGLETQYDASDALSQFAPQLPGPAAYVERDRNELFFGEANFASEKRGRMQWLAGAFYSQGDETSSSQLQAPPDGAVPYAEDRKDTLREAALYGEATYALTRRLSITAGLRAFHAERRTTSVVSADGAAPRPFDGHISVQDVSPKLVVSYQLSPKIMIYAQAGEGYRIGGFNTAGPAGQMFSNPGAGPQPDRRYQPDELWSYEAGAKLTLLDGAAHLRTAVYYAAWRDIQTDQYLPSGLPYTGNVGDGTNSGVEAEGDWRATPYWTLKGAILLDDPELSKPDPTAAATGDIGLPGVPGVSASASAAYRRPFRRDLYVIGDLQVSYVGSSHLTFDQASAARMGNYVTGRLSVGVEGRHVRIVGFVDNPANTSPNTFAFGNPFSITTIRQLTPLRPRTIGVELGWRF